MLDNQLYALIRNQLTAAAPLRGFVDGNFYLRYQPLQQGRPEDPTVWMHKINDKRYGARRVEQRWIAGQLVTRTEVQEMESTLQFSVTQPQALQDVQLTHGDVLKIIAASLQSDDALRYFIANGASVLRVTDIRNTFVVNDRNQNEENPTFDLTVKHEDIFVDGVPYFDRFEASIHAVPNIA